MMVIVAALLFLQTAGIPDQLANVIPDPTTQDQLDIQFADGTLWGLNQLQGCDWLSAGQQIVWSPMASGSVAMLSPIPADDSKQCYADTFVVGQ